MTSYVAELISALFDSFRNVHLILGLLGPSTVLLYSHCSGKASYFKVQYVLLVHDPSNVKRFTSFRFHRLFCSGFCMTGIHNNPVTGGLNNCKSLSCFSQVRYWETSFVCVCISVLSSAYIGDSVRIAIAMVLEKFSLCQCSLLMVDIMKY